MVTQPSDLRRSNLRRVVDELGGPTGVAKRLKLSGPSWLSQLISGHRPFTEKTARKFERALGLKQGTLDQENASQHSLPVIVNRDVPQISESLEVVKSLLTKRNQTLTNAKFGAVVQIVFTQAMTTGKADASLAEQILDLI